MVIGIDQVIIGPFIALFRCHIKLIEEENIKKMANKKEFLKCN